MDWRVTKHGLRCRSHLLLAGAIRKPSDPDRYLCPGYGADEEIRDRQSVWPLNYPQLRGPATLSQVGAQTRRFRVGEVLPER